jgi:hypothetical protein
VIGFMSFVEFGGPDLVSKYVDTKDQTESLDVLASIIHSAAPDPTSSARTHSAGKMSQTGTTGPRPALNREL